MPIERIDRAKIEAGPDGSPERLPKFSETVRSDGSGKSGRAVSIGDRIVDLHRDALLDRQGAVIALRPRAWLVLKFLAQRPGRLVEKNELLEEVWADCVVTEDSLVQAIGDIRRALGDAGRTALRTLPRRGYTLMPDQVRSQTAGINIGDRLRAKAEKRFVGRASELAELDNALAVESGGTQLYFVHGPDTSAPSIQDVFKEMVADEARNDLIFDDVLRALEAGRSPVVITERTAHLEIIAKRLERFARHVVVLRGGQSEKQRRDVAARLAAIPKAEERVIVATGRYLGEGFDDSRLDTLFLTMPIAWKGTLAQYAGRLHRLNDAKREVIIYDYADMRVPVLARMAAKRRVGYQAIGYKVLGARDLFSDRAVTPNEPA